MRSHLHYLSYVLLSLPSTVAYAPQVPPAESCSNINQMALARQPTLADQTVKHLLHTQALQGPIKAFNAFSSPKPSLSRVHQEC